MSGKLQNSLFLSWIHCQHRDSWNGIWWGFTKLFLHIYKLLLLFYFNLTNCTQFPNRPCTCNHRGSEESRIDPEGHGFGRGKEFKHERELTPHGLTWQPVRCLRTLLSTPFFILTWRRNAPRFIPCVQTPLKACAENQRRTVLSFLWRFRWTRRSHLSI